MSTHTEDRMETATLWLVLFLAVFHRPVMLVICWVILTLAGHDNIAFPATLKGWMFG